MKKVDEESNLFPFRRRVLGIVLNLSVFVCFHIEEARNFLILIAENNKTMSEWAYWRTDGKKNFRIHPLNSLARSKETMDSMG